MLEFLKSLVSLDTNSSEGKNYEECASLITKEAKTLGFKPKIHYAEAPDGKPRPNVLIDLDAGAEKTLLINAHYDVVPAGDGWNTDPFELTIKDGKGFGRGASDDKGSVALSLYAISEARSKINLQLAYTCDEEIGGYWGLGELVRSKLVNADAALIIDGSPIPTAASSGFILGKLRFKGKGGHAGKPFDADNPVPKLLTFLNELKNYTEVRQKSKSEYFGTNKKQLYGRFTLTMLEGSKKENVIANEAIAGFDLRINPDERLEDVVSEFKAYVEKISRKTEITPQLELSIKNTNYASKGDFVERMKKITGTESNYSTWASNDGSHLAGIIPSVTFGVIAESNNIHAANEFVILKDLDYAKGIVKKIAEEGW